ncbi:hypothetical protein X777_03687 [Ooceraea biroi]|uniref:Uncharacterized protein n=1 Tax=Ooceraea biroi TaxID=2015173 RepID=A0A026WIY2_OOCBI|nr:hypothetical protein X777_03687 [Ooceraea biroi]
MAPWWIFTTSSPGFSSSGSPRSEKWLRRQLTEITADQGGLSLSAYPLVLSYPAVSTINAVR